MRTGAPAASWPGRPGRAPGRPSVLDVPQRVLEHPAQRPAGGPRPVQAQRLGEQIEPAQHRARHPAPHHALPADVESGPQLEPGSPASGSGSMASHGSRCPPGRCRRADPSGAAGHPPRRPARPRPPRSCGRAVAPPDRAAAPTPRVPARPSRRRCRRASASRRREHGRQPRHEPGQHLHHDGLVRFRRQRAPRVQPLQQLRARPRIDVQQPYRPSPSQARSPAATPEVSSPGGWSLSTAAVPSARTTGSTSPAMPWPGGPSRRSSQRPRNSAASRGSAVSQARPRASPGSRTTRSGRRGPRHRVKGRGSYGGNSSVGHAVVCRPARAPAHRTCTRATLPTPLSTRTQVRAPAATTMKATDRVTDHRSPHDRIPGEPCSAASQPPSSRASAPAVRCPAPGAAAHPHPDHPLHPGRRYPRHPPGPARRGPAAQRRTLVRRGTGPRRRCSGRALRELWPPSGRHLRPLGRDGEGHAAASAGQTNRGARRYDDGAYDPPPPSRPCAS